MSSRLHNKWHRHNHHTDPINDTRYPDSGHDPIASSDSPFQGSFFLNGSLSASNVINAQRIILNSPAATNTITLSTDAVVSGDNITASVSGLKITVNGQDFIIPLLSSV
jgi:hypothetical protein